MTPKPFVWYEIMTTDMEAAKAFYGAVLGWTARAADQPSTAYTIMSAGGAAVAGVMPLPEPVRQAGGRPGWLGYIYADDVDAATEGVRQAGGAVHRAPADLPGVGRFSVVADPQGAVFILFKPSGGDATPAAPMTPGHVGWHELYASDRVAAFDFYARQFGWTKGDAVDMGPMGTYQLFTAGAEPIGGMMNMCDGVPSPAWMFYFVVPEAEAAAARITSKGGQVLMDPHQVPGGGWIVQGMDPQGAMFALVAPAR